MLLPRINKASQQKLKTASVKPPRGFDGGN